MNIAELFSRDPREHTDEDVKKIIAELRASRSKFIIGGDKSAGALTTSQKEAAKLNLDIKL